MKRILLTTIVAVMLAAPAIAKPDLVSHYACHDKTSEYRYALALNQDRNIVKVEQYSPPSEENPLTTYRIVKGDPENGHGWILSGGAKFSYATRGYATLTLHGHDLECDLADTE
jgi:hypothetical protein